MTHPQPQGFLALPPTGKGPGVLVLHPWWGLNDTIRAFCTQLAEAGFVVFAADLYRGEIATTIQEAERLSSALDSQQARADIADAVNFLAARATGSGLGVVGFSLGAFLALDLSGADPERIRAVVVFYGTGSGNFTASRADYLGHFASSDEFEPDTEVNRLEDTLREAGRRVMFHRYPGTGHWFFEPDRTDAYNPAAATLAWERTLTFLRDTLPSESS